MPPASSARSWISAAAQCWSRAHWTCCHSSRSWISCWRAFCRRPSTWSSVYHPEAYLVHADPTRLQQVFMNLALNARDAMPNGGVIRFSLDNFELFAAETPPIPELLPGRWIKIEVTDTGKGIPQDVIPHIFEPFFTTKPVGQGTGLGLAQVYGIIKGHGGFIEVYSQPGDGTIFTIYLPALEAPEIEAPDRQILVRTKHGIRSIHPARRGRPGGARRVANPAGAAELPGIHRFQRSGGAARVG